jgi:hypothetical protein
MYIQKLERFEKFKQPENKREEGKFRIRCMGRVGNIQGIFGDIKNIIGN